MRGGASCFWPPRFEWVRTRRHHFDRRRPEVGCQRKGRDTGQTPTNVADIPQQTVRRLIEGAPHQLTQSDKNQGDQGEEETRQNLDRNKELRQVLAGVFSAE